MSIGKGTWGIRGEVGEGINYTVKESQIIPAHFSDSLFRTGHTGRDPREGQSALMSEWRNSVSASV